MKGQFFVMATVIMIYTLMTLVHYIYDFSDINLLQLKKMSEAYYIQYIKDTLNKTVMSSKTSIDCDKLQTDIITTENFLKNEMLSRGTNLTINHIIDCSSLNAYFYFSLITPELYTYTEFNTGYVTAVGGLEYAQYNSTLKAPDCHGGSPCIASSSLLQCRDSDSIGEPNKPNNNIDTCSDLGGGTCHSSPSVENITVESMTHNYIGQGDIVRVNVTYYCQDSFTTYLALFYTNSTTSINWQRISSTGITCISGYNTTSWTFTLNNTGGKHAVRGAENSGELSSACSNLVGWWDADDLAFDVY